MAGHLGGAVEGHRGGRRADGQFDFLDLPTRGAGLGAVVPAAQELDHDLVALGKGAKDRGAGNEAASRIARRIRIEGAQPLEHTAALDHAVGIAIGREVVARNYGKGPAVDADEHLAAIPEVTFEGIAVREVQGHSQGLRHRVGRRIQARVVRAAATVHGTVGRPNAIGRVIHPGARRLWGGVGDREAAVAGGEGLGQEVDR